MMENGSGPSTAGGNGSGERWFLAQVKPNAWRIAARNLRRQDFVVFVPLENRAIRRRGRFVTERRLLFPGYLFIRFDPLVAPWRTINSTYGVVRLVSFGEGPPQPVPFGLVDAIMARCDEDDCLVSLESPVPGTVVRFTTGPFTEFVAKVEAIAPEQRVWVMIDVMGRETRVLATHDSLRRA